MRRFVLIVILAALVATSGFNVALAKLPAPPAKDMDKAVFIHYKIPAKPDGAGPKKPTREDEGYQLFRGGVKWSDSDLPVSYLINKASVPSYVNSDAAVNGIVTAFETWDTNTSKELYNNTFGITDRAGATRDGYNTIAWVNIGSSNIIAITTFWYYVNTKELIEFDIEFNTQFAWGIDLDGEGTTYMLVDAMDIRNITTHESGHTLVLDDLYQEQYAQMTMYGYSAYGEVKKISLELGDIAGLHKLYGK